MKYGYLIVEGYHDAEVIGRLLRRRNLVSVNRMDTLDEYWKLLVPKVYPPNGDLMKRVQVPLFFQNTGYSIAVQVAGGDLEMIGKKLEATLVNYDTLLFDVVGMGIAIDADYRKRRARERFNQLKKGIKKLVRLPRNPGQVLDGAPKTGVFVFPDNNDKGTIENILLKCGRQVYGDLLQGATNFIDGVNLDSLNANEKRDFKGRAGRNKAIVGCVANVLRPGKAVQVSIHDNRWIDDQTIGIREIAALDEFLEQLFELA